MRKLPLTRHNNVVSIQSVQRGNHTISKTYDNSLTVVVLQDRHLSPKRSNGIQYSVRWTQDLAF